MCGAPGAAVSRGPPRNGPSTAVGTDLLVSPFGMKRSFQTETLDLVEAVEERALHDEIFVCVHPTHRALCL
jgi:hypothetical protein